MNARVALLATALGACGARPTPAQFVAQRLAELPPAPPATPQRAALPSEAVARPPFRVFTWTSRTVGGGEEIRLVGRLLDGATGLLLDDWELPLQVASDGRSAVARLPEPATGEHTLRVRWREQTFRLSERYSPAKRDPAHARVLRCKFSRQVVDVPQQGRATLGPRSEAIRFDCDTEGAPPAGPRPLTAFLGGAWVTPLAIAERKDGFWGYVYDARDVQPGDPFLVDFGDGLRIPAPIAPGQIPIGHSTAGQGAQPGQNPAPHAD